MFIECSKPVCSTTIPFDHYVPDGLNMFEPGGLSRVPVGNDVNFVQVPFKAMPKARCSSSACSARTFHDGDLGRCTFNDVSVEHFGD